MKASSFFLAASLGMAMLTGCSSMDMGSASAKTAATGSAGGGTSIGENSSLQKCSAPLGTVTVYEDRSSNWYSSWHRRTSLGSTVPVLKMIIQQSNCFVVVDRGRGLKAAMKERSLNKSGELRSTSSMQKGQMVAADYTMSPSITVSDRNASGLSGSLAGRLFGEIGSRIAGSVKSSEASTMLTLSDNRSTVQLAAAEGSASNTDFGLSGGLYGALARTSAKGYASTDQGKVVVAAFVDAYNNLVMAVRNYKAQDVQGGMGAGGNLHVN